MEIHSLQDNFVRTQVLENELDHLQNKVEKLCEQLDKSLPLLTEINIRMHDDLSRRAYLEGIVTSLVDKMKDVSFIQISTQKIIDKHEIEIEDLKKISTVIKSSKIYSKTIFGLVSFIFIVASGWYALDSHLDRNLDRQMKLENIRSKNER